jgi:peptidoglycan/xylan/chitin deacetylase (PgdA/CDA1 family)
MRCAAAFTFDLDAEEGWLADDPANADRPVALSQGTYGPKVAVPLLLDLLREHGVTATFFVPGRVAERHRGRVEQIVAAGHELAHHGYTHRAPASLSRDEEEQELVRALGVLRSFDTEVVGYRAPAWDLSPHTLGLVDGLGFAYSSNLMDDLRPYRHEGLSLVELPVQWTLDDAAHFWFDPDTWSKTIASASSVREIWEGEFRGIHRTGGAFVLTMHPQVIGRPYRLEMLDAFLGWVRGHNDVWVAPCRELAARVP